MILVVSRFRVGNGVEEEIAEAFAGRPRMVEHAPGFLGMEVYRPLDDPAAFHLVTRWTDEASYRDWHRSDARRESQSSIPKGLKLDPAHTRIEVLERLDGRSADGATERLVLDSAGIVAELASTCARSLILLAVDASGCITGMSHSAVRALGIPPDAAPPPSL